MQESPARASGFTAVCAVGIVLALLVGVRQAGHRDPLRVSDQEHTIGERTVSGSAVVTNHSAERRCPDVRLAVLDGGSKTVAEVRARPADGAPALEPKQHAVYRAEVTSLTEDEIKEDASKVLVYVYEGRRC